MGHQRVTRTSYAASWGMCGEEQRQASAERNGVPGETDREEGNSVSGEVDVILSTVISIEPPE